jgi:shikimate dehydrogenase
MKAIPRLSGHTRPFAVLGHPIGHTLSPVMHNASFHKLGLDAIYLAFDVAPEKLMVTLPVMGEMGFAGVNLTVPLKEVAFRGLTDLDESARLLGSVNTIQFLPAGQYTPAGLRGYSTDGRGFLLALNEAFSITPKGRTVLLLGSGGAGRAVAITCARAGARKIFLTDLDVARAGRVAAEISRLAPRTATEVVLFCPDAWRSASMASNLVIQATPVGMKKGEKSLLDPDAFRSGQCVYDLIYMYPQTPFMKAATRGGARVSNGLGMLLHQGAFSFQIWTGKKADVKAMRRALEAEVYGAG